MSLAYLNKNRQDDMDYEFNAQFDSISEAYAATARDCDEMARQDYEYDNYLQEQHKKYAHTLETTTVWSFISMTATLIDNGHNRSDVVQNLMGDFTKYKQSKWDINYTDVLLSDIVNLYDYIEEISYIDDIYGAFEAHARDSKKAETEDEHEWKIIDETKRLEKESELN